MAAEQLAPLRSSFPRKPALDALLASPHDPHLPPPPPPPPPHHAAVPCCPPKPRFSSVLREKCQGIQNPLLHLEKLMSSYSQCQLKALQAALGASHRRTGSGSGIASVASGQQLTRTKWRDKRQIRSLWCKGMTFSNGLRSCMYMCWATCSLHFNCRA